MKCYMKSYVTCYTTLFHKNVYSLLPYLRSLIRNKLPKTGNRHLIPIPIHWLICVYPFVCSARGKYGPGVRMWSWKLCISIPLQMALYQSGIFNSCIYAEGLVTVTWGDLRFYPWNGRLGFLSIYKILFKLISCRLVHIDPIIGIGLMYTGIIGFEVNIQVLNDLFLT